MSRCLETLDTSTPRHLDSPRRPLDAPSTPRHPLNSRRRHHPCSLHITLDKHSLPTCMQHPCLALHSSFLATFASSLDSGDWRCLPVCVAASALFGCQHCCHVDIIACHTLACQLCILHSLPPLQATWIVGIGVACRFALQRRRCLGWQALLPGWHHGSSTPFASVHCSCQALLGCQPLVHVAHWSLLCKLLLQTCSLQVFLPCL